MEEWKKFAAGFNTTRWCVGLQIHDWRQKRGYGVIEVNILPLTFYFRFGNGLKKLYCQYCESYIGDVNPEESESVSCMDCYRHDWRDRMESRAKTLV